MINLCKLKNYYRKIPLFVIEVCEGSKFSMTTQMVLIAFMLLYFVGFIVFTLVFFKAMFGFSQLLAEKIYFLVCTTKGNALFKKDFKIIKKLDEALYSFISTQECRGFCYSICFAICKVLKRGSIEFLAVKNFSTNNKQNNDGKYFTMHVIYIFKIIKRSQFPGPLFEVSECFIFAFGMALVYCSSSNM